MYFPSYRVYDFWPLKSFSLYWQKFEIFGCSGNSKPQMKPLKQQTASLLTRLCVRGEVCVEGNFTGRDNSLQIIFCQQ